jgi:hypothetical protein
MFGFCRDHFTRELHKRGYCVVALAEAGIHPREVVGRQGRELFRFGDLLSLFESDTAEPEVKRDVTSAPIDVTETGGLEGRLGALILARWLGGDKAGVASRLRNVHRLRLKIADIQKEYVDLGALDPFLAKAQLRVEAPTVERLMEADSLYVITAVLKAPSMTFESQSGDLISADVQATEVHSGVSGSVKAQLEGKEGTRIVFTADAPVVFAFQAAKLLYEYGNYVCLEPDRGKLTLMGEKDETPGEPRLVDEIGSGMASFAG